MTRYKLLFSISLLSAALIAFQIALIQILAIVQWHHFAFMVISVAMLGFGAAATVLAIFRETFSRHSETLLPVWMIATGITMAIVTAISQSEYVRFDSYLLFAQYAHAGNLLLTYLLFFIPFFLGALAIGQIFILHVADIGKIYFANLLGSGAGGLMAVTLIWLFTPERLPPVLSVFPALAGILIFPNKVRLLHVGLAVIAMAVSLLMILRPPPLVLSQYKDLSKTLLLPDARIQFERTSPYGLTQAVSAPVLRYAPGLSLMASKAASISMAVFNNADWLGAVTEIPGKDSSMVLDYTTFGLPYAIDRRKKVLVLKSGTGMDVVHAITQQAETVVAVEPNTVIISSLKGELASKNDSLFYHPAVTLYPLEARTFLLRDTSRYDLIVLPVIGSFGGEAGLNALHEQFMLTRESFVDMWRRLNDGGVISVTTWMDYPPRNPLKVLATMAEVMDELQIENPAWHIAGVRSWGTITFVMSKSRFTDEHLRNVRSFCDHMLFDPALLPDLKNEERTRYNQMDDNRFFGYIDQLFTEERTLLYRDYDFNIRPATDDKPYFSQFLRWKSFERLSGSLGTMSLPFVELGYLLVIITLIQTVILSIILVMVPLLRLRWRGKNKGTTILYFTGIGMGYMFVEMVFIQRFMLYLGNPVYASSTVITVLLIFSGIGSYTAGYFIKRTRAVPIIFSLIVLILLIYSFLLTPILQATVHLTFPVKIVISTLLIMPLAFCMGIPFPNGLTVLSKKAPPIIPWAWGINGCASVNSTALATIVAVELGFAWVMWLAAFAYCLPLIVELKWK